MVEQDIVIAFNYAFFKNTKQADRQNLAITVLKQLPNNFSPVAFSTKGEEDYPDIMEDIPWINDLDKNSRDIVGNDRDLPYIKEILDRCCELDNITVIGYINSDILLGNDFINAMGEKHEAYIFSRFEIAEVNCNAFLEGKYKVIYGGDSHIGADGFFFDKTWWFNNRKYFPDNLIIGETEWDTCYRRIIASKANDFVEKRVLFHVYHDAKWTKNSNGAKNNIKILESLDLS